jgi:hypothetical protein
MAEPLDPDREAAQSPLPDSNDPDEGLSEDDLDIDALVSVWRDDLLLDAIGCAARGSDRPEAPFDVSADRQLIEALLQWRRDVESDAPAPVGTDLVPDLVPDTPMGADAGGTRRPRFRVPLVSTLAAAVVLVFTALAAYGAGPNEALWPVTEVLYSQHAASVQAADDAGTAQAQAEAAMAAGHTHEAQAALNAAARRLPQVRSQDGQTNLQNRQRDLERQLNAPAGPTVERTPGSAPGAPPRSARTSAPPKPTSHPLRSESPTARAKESHDSTDRSGSAATTAPQTRPTPAPTSASPTAPPRHEQPGKPPRSTGSVTPPTTRPAPGTARSDSKAPPTSAPRVVPVKPSTKKAPLTTPQPKAQTTAAPSTGQAVEPSSSVRTPRDRQRQSAAKQPDSPVPTPRPSPDSTPS